MKKEIQKELLQQIISLARKAMVSEQQSAVEQPSDESASEECPMCSGEGCDECEMEAQEPEFKNGNIRFVKVKVKRPKGLKSVVEKLMEE